MWFLFEFIYVWQYSQFAALESELSDFYDVPMPRFPPKTLNLFSNKSKFDDAVLQKRMNELQLFLRELLSFEVFAKSAILLDWLQAANEVKDLLL